ncbi:hypothetical protein SMA5143A_2023 [Streptomyces sp. MA5143a]|nr:hypothetical protein SMA5143A_2023 [Streptomyces sp. MA5143a]
MSGKRAEAAGGGGVAPLAAAVLRKSEKRGCSARFRAAGPPSVSEPCQGSPPGNRPVPGEGRRPGTGPDPCVCAGVEPAGSPEPRCSRVVLAASEPRGGRCPSAGSRRRSSPGAPWVVKGAEEGRGGAVGRAGTPVVGGRCGRRGAAGVSPVDGARPGRGGRVDAEPFEGRASPPRGPAGTDPSGRPDDAPPKAPSAKAPLAEAPPAKAPPAGAPRSDAFPSDAFPSDASLSDASQVEARAPPEPEVVFPAGGRPTGPAPKNGRGPNELSPVMGVLDGRPPLVRASEALSLVGRAPEPLPRKGRAPGAPLGRVPEAPSPGGRPPRGVSAVGVDSRRGGGVSVEGTVVWGGVFGGAGMCGGVEGRLGGRGGMEARRASVLMHPPFPRARADPEPSGSRSPVESDRHACDGSLPWACATPRADGTRGHTTRKPYPWQRIGIPVEVVPCVRVTLRVARGRAGTSRRHRGFSPERPPTLR